MRAVLSSESQPQDALALVPFGEAPRPGDLQIHARLRRTPLTPAQPSTAEPGQAADALQLRFALRGDLAQLAIPAAPSRPERRDELWQTTCLELFLALPGQEAYWELNLSPSGDWNVYRLEGYRLNLAPEAAIARLPFEVRLQPGALDLELTLPLALLPGAAAAAQLEAALTAVVESAAGKLSYWALVHPGSRPDFHRRDGFVLRV